jgi:hypothetical protein
MPMIIIIIIIIIINEHAFVKKLLQQAQILWVSILNFSDLT